MLTVQEQLAQAQAENARLKAALAAKPKRSISYKVSPKGAVSVYGLGRFPVTLYAGQWETLLGSQDALKAFIQANAQALQDQRA